MTIICCTLVPQKIYSVYEWFDAVSRLEGFDGETHVLFNKYASIYKEGNDSQMIDDRNKLRDMCLEKGEDMWLLDSDTIPEPDAFTKLNSVKSDIVAGIVKNPDRWNVFVRDDGRRKGMPVSHVDVEPNTGVRDGVLVQFGCAIIRLGALQEIPFSSKYKGASYRVAHDLLYCMEAEDRDMKVSCHTGVACRHLKKHFDGWVDKPRFKEVPF